MLRTLCLASLAFSLVGVPALPQQQQKQQQAGYPVFETDLLPARIYKARREQVKQTIGQNGIAMVFTNPERNRTNDTDFRFRYDSNFYYLTGFDEPDAALLLVPGGITWQGQKVTEILFVNVSDPMSETWLGYRMGPDNATNLLGVELALPNSKLAQVLKEVPVGQSTTIWPHIGAPAPSGGIARLLKNWTDWIAASGKQQSNQRLGTTLAKMRVKKSPEELVLLKKAVDASVLGHREAMRTAEPNMREYEVQAVVEYAFKKAGCEDVGYNSIVGSGPNSCILHYEADRRIMKDGEIICMDVAGEYHGYSADVTRSFPVNGKFSPAQKTIYELVLEAQEAGIQACKVGASFNAADDIARKIIGEGLVKLGITKTAAEADRYFMHGTSHYIGLDVHDSHGDNTLQENYTLTVEPGIYIKAGSPCDPKWWNIGVRIEDDILVTASGPVNMSAGAPRSVAAIEALMKEKGLGNLPVGK